LAISEQQLITWSHQGSIKQSATTYSAIKTILEDKNAPYANRSFKIFLQGSYGNDTNIYADSDVDIVICLTSTYYFDVSNLDPIEKAAFEANRSPASYGFNDFKKEVFDWLKLHFGTGVKQGKKAIFIPRTEGRRDADVLACSEHHQYLSYRSSWDNQFHKGICFWASDGTKVINFPKQHRENCTAKHQNTSSRFKANVRVFKNMRNTMINANYIAKGIALSYFIEGMLWNVPSQDFTSSYQQTFENCLYWLDQCNPTQLTCANGLHWLIRDGADVCWNMKDFQSLTRASKLYWNSGGR
jgi:hypothetical protein